jgi:hypothetical protein
MQLHKYLNWNQMLFHHVWNHLFNFIVLWIFYKQNCLLRVFHFSNITERKVLNKAKCDERRQCDAITKCFSFAKIWEIVFFVKPPSRQSWFFKKRRKCYRTELE